MKSIMPVVKMAKMCRFADLLKVIKNIVENEHLFIKQMYYK